MLKCKNILNISNSSSNVTLTITACKRPKKLERMLKSISESCLDKHLIREIICIDDGTDASELDRLIKKYPFINWIINPARNKGHANALNVLFNQVKTKYTFHMEDDWVFVEKGKFISECLNVLKSKESIKQVVLYKHRHYNLEEDIKNIKYARTESGISDLGYIDHPAGLFWNKDGTPKEGNEMSPLSQISIENYSSWAGFTLNPSVFETSLINGTGRFLSERFFEVKYAKEFLKRGYKSVALLKNYAYHMDGHWVRKAPTAYQLNKTER